MFLIFMAFKNLALRSGKAEIFNVKTNSCYFSLKEVFFAVDTTVNLKDFWVFQEVIKVETASVPQ